MTADAPVPARSGAQAVERALSVLACFDEDGVADLGITALAHGTGLTASTVHRLVRALCVAGMLVQDSPSERYRLGPQLVVLGRRAERHLGYARAEPVLERVASETGESVNLGVRADRDVLVVLDVSSEQPLRFDQATGTRVPVHTSAMGKCLLAFAPDIEAELVALGELVGVTDRTITDAASLRAELERTRARGWSLNDEERNPGVRAVGAPVLHDGAAIAAVAVQGPTVRLTDGTLDRVAGVLTSAAEDLARVLARGG